jgi:putative exosortase-associated protein (TIGR04073 family)
MVSARTMGIVLIALMAWVPQAHATEGTIQAGGAMGKLGRGFVNVVTGWVEIPKRIYETSQDQGAAAGWTWGLLRGLGHGIVRTAAGFYELVTFPFPAPPDYAPVIEPEYVFTESSTTK